MDGDPLLDVIPEDALREVLEAEEGLRQRRRGRRKPYPSSRDVMEAVAEAARSYYGHPDEFPDYVVELLEDEGFDTRHVTVKRIWRCYEELVRRGVVADTLHVVEGAGSKACSGGGRRHHASLHKV